MVHRAQGLSPASGDEKGCKTDVAHKAASSLGSAHAYLWINPHRTSKRAGRRDPQMRLGPS